LEYRGVYYSISLPACLPACLPELIQLPGKPWDLSWNIRCRPEQFVALLEIILQLLFNTLSIIP